MRANFFVGRCPSSHSLGYLPLMTNPRPSGSSPESAEGRVLSYLEHVNVAARGKPLCPFTQAISHHNGYCWRNDQRPVEEIALDPLVDELKAVFTSLSPGESGRQHPVDLTVVFVAFSHESAMRTEFGTRLNQVRDLRRPEFLDRGLMLSQMFPKHADPKGTAGYNSKIPILVVRRMHEPDLVFMHTHSEKAAYYRQFPGPGLFTPSGD